MSSTPLLDGTSQPTIIDKLSNVVLKNLGAAVDVVVSPFEGISGSHANEAGGSAESSPTRRRDSLSDLDEASAKEPLKNFIIENN